MTTAHEILKAAQKHMVDRAKKYDNPKGERSMKATVAAFNAVTDSSMTEEQGWLFMVILKAVRSQQGDYDIDSFEDGAAYFALAGEAANFDRKSEKKDAWIPWHGLNSRGPSDDPESCYVIVKFREWPNATGTAYCHQLDWNHRDQGMDIIAYRIVK